MNAAVLPAGLLLCALLCALAVDVRGPDVHSSGPNLLDGQSDDERSWHTNLAPHSALAELCWDMAEGRAGRGASRTVGVGLMYWPLPSRADLASSAAPIGDQVAATAAAVSDASATAHQRSWRSHNTSLCRSVAEAKLEHDMGSRLDASQHSSRHADPFANDAARSKVTGERGAHSRASLSTAIMTRRSLHDEPCADAQSWRANSTRTRLIQVRAQCSHASVRHLVVI